MSLDCEFSKHSQSNQIEKLTVIGSHKLNSPMFGTHTFYLNKLHKKKKQKPLVGNLNIDIFQAFWIAGS